MVFDLLIILITKHLVKTQIRGRIGFNEYEYLISIFFFFRLCARREPQNGRRIRREKTRKSNLRELISSSIKAASVFAPHTSILWWVAITDSSPSRRDKFINRLYDDVFAHWSVGLRLFTRLCRGRRYDLALPSIRPSIWLTVSGPL